MKADSYKISKVFSSGGDIQYILPHFQRQYSWDKSNWQTLLDDAIAIYEEFNPNKEPEHFLGSLVVINSGTRSGLITAFTLVDGQQRLTTISLLLCAFRDLIESTEPKIAAKIQRYLVNSETEGDIYFKLLPTNKYGDRQAYISLIQKTQVEITESKIPVAYHYLHKELGKLLTDGAIEAERFFFAVSNCFQVVFIELNRDESPYKIFESLNAKGKPLSQADLARNYIAMKLPPAQQEKVFTEQWEKVEHLLQESRIVGRSRIGELTAFLRHYLATQSRGVCSEAHTYARFRDRCEEFQTDAEFINEISLLRRFAEHYNKLLRPEHEKNLEIRHALHRLNILEIQTAYSFLLLVYENYEQEKLTDVQFKQILAILENYMIRRYVCREQTKDLSKVFPPLWRDIQDEINGEEITFIEALKKILISKNYPSDQGVQQSIRSINIYDDRSREKICLILESINRHLSRNAGGITTLNATPTVEHIMPQTLNSEWKTELGENFERVHQDNLNTFGNLTLLTQEWNSALSNSAFSLKKKRLEEHEFRLNKDYFSNSIERWDEQAILDRADFLSEKFLEIWSALGEPIAIGKIVHGKPIAITILGERIDIPNKTWRQVRTSTVEWVLHNRPQDFNRIRQAIGIFDDSIEGKNYPKDWYQLSNGVWVHHCSSAKQHIVYCRRILATIGISESDWSIDEEDVTTLVS
ncbi:DUF262 domain-containing protein [Leptolyngbya sp. AN03gr2]|uniref:DUF262 domain-containing protein n=1 Tax=unclassified Leptolyngbya TaxID=2650499 RepID=UPI003D31D334